MKECKLCKTTVAEDAAECPSCGCDPDTGMTLVSKHGFRRQVALRAEDRHWSQRGLATSSAV